MSFKPKETCTSILNTIEKWLRINPLPVTVLAYHSISSDKTIVDIEPSMFRKQIQIMREYCDFISLDEVVEYMSNTQSYKRPAVALTFDDGYKDLVKEVMPICNDYNIPASVFVITHPEAVDRRELANDKPLLNWEEINLLQKYGWTIGCHSATHPNFGQEKLDIAYEIIDSKKYLEQKINQAVNYFVYPKGIYSDSVLRAVEKAGYKAAFAFEPGSISNSTNRFAIPRMPVDWTHTEKQFEAFFTRWGVGYLQARHNLIKNFSLQ